MNFAKFLRTPFLQNTSGWLLLTKLHDPNRRKMRLPCFELRWLLNGMNIPWHSVFLFFFIFLFLFLFRNNVIRDQLDVNDFSCCYVFLPESTIPKVLDHSYVQISLSTITSQLDNSIWKTPYTEYFMDIGVKLALSHLTYYCMLPFSQTSLVFKFNLLFDWMIFATIYLPFNLLILYLEVYLVPLRSFHKSQ